MYLFSLSIVSRLLEQQGQLMTLLTSMVLQQQSQATALLSQYQSPVNLVTQNSPQQLLQFLHQSQSQLPLQPQTQSSQLPNFSSSPGSFQQLLRQLPLNLCSQAPTHSQQLSTNHSQLNSQPANVRYSQAATTPSTQLLQSVLSSQPSLSHNELTPVYSQQSQGDSSLFPNISTQYRVHSQSSRPNIQPFSPAYSQPSHNSQSDNFQPSQPSTYHSNTQLSSVQLSSTHMQPSAQQSPFELLSHRSSHLATPHPSDGVTQQFQSPQPFSPTLSDPSSSFSHHSEISSEGTSRVGGGTSSNGSQKQGDCIILDEFSWDDTAGEDSDYMTWDTDNTDSTLAPRSSGITPADHTLAQPIERAEVTFQPSGNHMWAPASTSSESPLASREEVVQPPAIPPPFDTPPKLCSVQQVLKNYPGKDVASLRSLTVALARDAIFGREALSKCSLSGRKGTGVLSQEKVRYIKQLVHSRVPKKSLVDFENIWSMCRLSLSKSCQTLRNSARKKLLPEN